MTDTSSPLNIYESADFFMARNAVLPFQMFDLMEEVQDPQQALLDFYFAHPEFQEAIAIASPNLHQSLKLLKGKLSNDALEKVYPGLLKYFLRMCARTTPFGLFSCVSWGTFHEVSRLDFHASSIKKSIRPDMEWVHTLVQQLEQEQNVIPHLRVMTNPNVISKGERFSLFKKQEQKNSKNLVSIKRTSFSETALALAKTPLLMGELEEKLLTLFQDFEKEKIIECLRQIFKENFIISELSIRPDCQFTLEQVMNLVQDHYEHDEKKFLIEKVGKLIDAYKNSEIGNGVSLLDEIYKQCDELKKVDYPVQVDAIVQGDPLTLNQRIKDEVAEAATVLWHFTPQGKTSNQLDQFRMDFLEKYGPYRLVSLVEIADEISEYVHLSQAENVSSTAMNQPKHQLLSQNYEKEIILDERIQDFFETTPEKLQKAPFSLEIYFDLLAASNEEIDRGNYTIVCNPVVASMQAGNTFGRFLAPLDRSKDRVASLHEFLRKESTLSNDALFVEASFLPENPRTSNVCFFEKVREFQLPFHYHEQTENALSIDDIFIGAGDQGLYFYSKKLQKEIYVVLSSAVNPDLAPPLLKFMLNVTQSQFNSYSPYLWQGMGGSMRYLPRVRYKNVVLCPARWSLDYASAKIKEGMNPTLIESRLRQFLEDHEVVDRVYLTYYDHRLLVNWRNRDHFKLILQQFEKAKEIVLFEALSNSKNQPLRGILGSHSAEFVLPLVKKFDYRKPKQSQQFPTTQSAPLTKRLSLFHSQWLYAKLYFPEELQESFISKDLAVFIKRMEERGLINKWFYVRYKEKQSHVRLRLHAVSENIKGNLFQEIMDWAATLISDKLIYDISLHTYDREVERYGGVECIEEAEEVFASDSKAALYLFNVFHACEGKLPLIGLASLSIIHYLTIFLENNTESAINFLGPIEKNNHLLAGSREQLRLMSDFAQRLFLNGQENMLDPQDPVFHLKAALSLSFSAINDYKEKIEELNQRTELWSSREVILNSIIHMHCNRLLGLSATEENKARVMAAHLLNRLHYMQKRHTSMAAV